MFKIKKSKPSIHYLTSLCHLLDYLIYLFSLGCIRSSFAVTVSGFIASWSFKKEIHKHEGLLTTIKELAKDFKFRKNFFRCSTKSLTSLPEVKLQTLWAIPYIGHLLTLGYCYLENSNKSKEHRYLLQIYLERRKREKKGN